MCTFIAPIRHSPEWRKKQTEAREAHPLSLKPELFED